MIGKEKLDRINVLSKKSKFEGLNSYELEEQKELRKEYLSTFRKSFKERLENLDIEFVEDLEKEKN